MDIIEELRQITARFDHEGIDYALCGGVAMAIYAMPRATLDIDLMIQPKSLNRAEQAVAPLGFTLQGAPTCFQDDKIKIARLCKVDTQTAEAMNLDFLLVTDEALPTWNDRRDVEWEGREPRVVSPEGPILLKSFRGSGEDQDDIEYLRRIADEN